MQTFLVFAAIFVDVFEIEIQYAQYAFGNRIHSISTVVYGNLLYSFAHMFK